MHIEHEAFNKVKQKQNKHNKNPLSRTEYNCLQLKQVHVALRLGLVLKADPRHHHTKMVN